MNIGGKHRGGQCATTGIVRLGWLVAVLFLVNAFAPIAASAQDWSPPPTVFIPETGHTLDRLFLEQWQDDPELLGDPITEEVTTKVDLGKKGNVDRDVQYFENVALVYLPERDPGEQVALLPLGRDALARERKDPRASKELLSSLKRGRCASQDSSECVLDSATGHTVQDAFREFWVDAGGIDLLGRPLSEQVKASGGVTTQYFDRAVLIQKGDDDVKLRALGKEEAKRLKVSTKAVDQPESVPTYDASLFIAPPAPEVQPEPEPEDIAEPANGVPDLSVGGFGPGPVQGGSKEIVVSISTESLWAYEDGQMVLSTYVSTGVGDVPETVTPLGYHQILSKYDLQTMEGTISETYYRVPDVPWVMYFDDLGNALHGTYWHSNFGTPMSHGCVNLPLDVAEWMYGWAPIGTPVTVIE